MERRIRVKAFPPGGAPQFSLASARAATVGIRLYGPSSTKSTWMQRAGFVAVRMGLGKLLPWRSHIAEFPFEPDEAETILRSIPPRVRGTLQWTPYRRANERAGVVMVVHRADKPLAFVRAYKGQHGGLASELDALQLIEKARPTTFHAPRVLDAGSTGEWNFAIMSPMPPHMHRMMRTMPAPEVFEELSDALRGLPRPAGTPTEWAPAHRDFTPWNVRRVGRDPRPWVFDWEVADWAPPGADEVYYAATAASIGNHLALPQPARPETAEYWLDILQKRWGNAAAHEHAIGPSDRRLTEIMGEWAASRSVDRAGAGTLVTAGVAREGAR